VANKEGRVAGGNAAGGGSRFGGIVGAACVKVFDLEIGMAGITEEGARRSLMRMVADAKTWWEGTERQGR
jgi:NADPH-dependent 2,4-dienoyl-CoA reductase/sulfur reductase-like enzyme